VDAAPDGPDFFFHQAGLEPTVFSDSLIDL
jgi:hypothetical protein